MKILIVSGFLGAGKTTFIRHMAEATGLPLVIFENEYAGAGIDTQRLQENDRLKIWESTENCVCCSGKVDFAGAIVAIASGLKPPRLVVEPTGAARLSSILRNVRKILHGDMELLPPLTIVDGVSWKRQLREYPEIFADQITSASFLLISKANHLLRDEYLQLTEYLKALNPSAVLLEGEPGRGGLLQLLNADGMAIALGRALSDQETAATEDETDEERQQIPNMPDSLTIRNAILPSPVHLIALLDAMAAGAFGSILRAKGALLCGNVWVRFDLINRRWCMTGCPEQERPACAFIGKNIDKEALERYFPIDIVAVHVPATIKRARPLRFPST